jgi:hypothetical protein
MQERLGQYHQASKEPAVVVLLVLPIFLLYGIGQISATSQALAGVDFISPFLRQHFASRGIVLFHLILAAIAIIFAGYKLRREFFSRTYTALPAIAESIAYAVILGSLVLFLMKQVHLLAVGPQEAIEMDRWVGAAGAAIHEEFVFRLLLIPFLLAIAMRFLGMPKGIAVAFAVVGSSLIFAGAHHWAGETYTNYAFAYRSVAGGIFAVLQLTRGFAVAVWTHASYDVYVTGL